MLTAATPFAPIDSLPPTAPSRRFLWLGIVMLFATMAIAMGAYANRFGADLTTDSGNYIACRFRHSQAIHDAIEFDVKSIDSTPWHVQACLTDIAFHTVDVSATIDEPDYHSIGLDKTIDLGIDWNEYSYTFKADRPLSDKNVITFVMGNEKGQVWIKDLRIVETK